MTPDVTLIVDGTPVTAHEGQSVAAALVAAGRFGFVPNAKTGSPLAPYCLMGVCFGCLCEIDGRPGSQACLIQVRDGMKIGLQGPPVE